MRCVLGVILLLLCAQLRAQSDYRIGLLPSINYNYKLNQVYSLNTKAEFRQHLEETVNNKSTSQGYQYQFTDISGLLARKFSYNHSWAAGYQIRVIGPGFMHRFIQQLNFVDKRKSIIFGHRIRSDQSIRDQELPVFRLRYRLSILLPLNGQMVDPKEFYFKLNNEYLGIHSGRVNDLEFRLIPLMGYVFSNNNKFEFGLDYRFGEIIRRGSNQSFWINLNWYLAS